MQMKNKSCELDTISTEKLKAIQDSGINTITKIVNISLTNGQFCDQWKTAIFKPILKKLGLELINRNYRPVSNLCLLSKLEEKCMLNQQLDDCNTNDLLPDFQSAFHQHYSTETSLINITNDILWGMENQEVMMMLILDWSAASDTVGHSILLKILNKSFGFCDQARKWFDMYLQPRWFKVCIDGNYSEPMELWFSIPQGSCSGANLFSCYCSLIISCIPLQLIINGFADNHSVRQQHKPTSKISLQVRATMQTTLTSTKDWTDSMNLKLNTDKTEFIIFS